jgi:hypothetical protein
MDTGYRSPRPPAGGNTWTTLPPRLPDVKGILASQQFPGLPPEADDRVRRALAAESARRVAAASETRTPVSIPRPRTGKQPPPLTHLVPRPRQAPAAA